MNRRNLHATFLGVVAVFVLATAFAGRTIAADANATAAAPGGKAAALDAALRDLWVGHIFWVRAVVVESTAGNRAAAAVAEKQVVANAQALGDAIAPFYGADASKQLFALLAGHYGAVKQYLEATLAGSKPKQDDAFKALTSNASAIAKFLSGANPHWPYDTLNVLLTGHGAHHVQQIEALHTKKYDDEAETWQAMKTHMYVIADALAAGLVQQFPEKF